MSHRTVEIVDASAHGKRLFDQEFPKSALFVASTLDEAGCLMAAKDMDAGLSAWRDRGIMPFPKTAIEWQSTPDLRTTAVFSVVPGTNRLRWVTRYAFVSDDRRVTMYAIFAEAPDSDGVLFVQPLEALDRKRTEFIQFASAMPLSAFVWLNDALTSAGFTSCKTAISRQEARATNAPRWRWVIDVRPRGSNSLSMRAQFEEIVRAAHAVRAHLRLNHRTGEKSIHVRPHIRGKLGDAVQLKDYLVAGTAS